MKQICQESTFLFMWMGRIMGRTKSKVDKSLDGWILKLLYDVESILMVRRYQKRRVPNTETLM